MHDFECAQQNFFQLYRSNQTAFTQLYILCFGRNNLIFAVLFYGMGESKLGNGASSWILHMAFIILIANIWGLVLNEWKGVSKKAYATVLAGIAVIILSVLLVGYGNSLQH
ncbi:MAG: L-rhamnose/proton symporter RhaT [Janthinobacterium lividum]